jgi:transposase
MFIREIKKKHPRTGRAYLYHRLMESVRTPRGPRQRTLLDLGKLDLPKEKWKALANRIEEIFSGQKSISRPEDATQKLAAHYARMLRRKEMLRVATEKAEGEEAQWETVDFNTLSHGESRTIGGEAIGYYAFKRIGLPGILTELGFSKWQINLSALLVIGRLLHPASERETALWGSRVSGLEELLGADFQHLSNNALYRLSDQLFAHRCVIEERLMKQEGDVFGLGEKIILYDLTNTYLTGVSLGSSKARRGRSKEKRKDSPLLTLGLVLDEDGFPKASKMFEGNVSEPATLKEMLDALRVERSPQRSLFDKPATVVMDAGVATAENIELIRKERLHYVCVSRSRVEEKPEGELEVIKEDKSSKVSAKKLDDGGEVLLYCESTGRARKEEAMKTLFQKRFEEGLRSISESLTKKRGIKGYAKVLQRVGRLRQRFPSIAQFYEIEVEHEGETATALKWSVKEEDKLNFRFSGAYLIRTDRRDLDEKALWSLYMMLTQVEAAFRSLKSDLGLRPVYHCVDRRMEGHLFITVLAYHLQATIQRELKKKGINHSWNTIRNLMATQTRVTASITNDKGERIHIRQTTDPEPFHYDIYQALGLHPKPLRSKCIRV